METKQLRSFLMVCVASLYFVPQLVAAETKMSAQVYYDSPKASVRISSGNDRVFMYNGREQRRYRPHNNYHNWTKPYRPSHQQYNNNYNYRNSCQVKYVRRQGNVTEIFCE